MLLTFAGRSLAHDRATHMYIAAQTFDVWRDYDLDFYYALIGDCPQGTETRKFYYIGLMLPDMLDATAQNSQIKEEEVVIPESLTREQTDVHIIKGSYGGQWPRNESRIPSWLFYEGSCPASVHKAILFDLDLTVRSKSRPADLETVHLT